MEVRIAAGEAGAAAARGCAVVIDVFRAFTVSAYALGAGATECLLVRTVAEARELAAEIPGALISAEVDGSPVPGVRISNSPAALLDEEPAGKVLVQRTSAGTQCAAAAAGAERLLAASFVTAGATARHLRGVQPALVTLVRAGADDVEDRECAGHISDLLAGRESQLAARLARIEADARTRRFRAGGVPGFAPADVDLALAVDRLGFAMEVFREGGRLRLRAVRA